jgi:DNA-binding NarL/FixJ family response regulator
MGISVLVADQERTFADALAVRLEAESDITVVGAVQVRMPTQGMVARAADVLVLDGDLPREGANRLCEELSGRGARTRVVMLTSSSAPARIVRALRAGAAAWVRKDESLEYLLSVIRGVACGETWLPPSETGSVMQLLLREHDRRRENERLLATLTSREREVLACLADGAGQRDVVAAQLHLSVNTVRTHLQNLMAKLGVHSALEALALTWDQEGWHSGEAAGLHSLGRTSFPGIGKPSPGIGALSSQTAMSPATSTEGCAGPASPPTFDDWGMDAEFGVTD